MAKPLVVLGWIVGQLAFLMIVGRFIAWADSGPNPKPWAGWGNRLGRIMYGKRWDDPLGEKAAHRDGTDHA